VQPGSLGTAASHAASDFATPSTVSSAISALNLGTASTHAASDFEAAGTAATAVSSHVSASDPHGDRAYANSAIASAASSYASAAQGSKADTAVQPGSLGSAASHAAGDFDTAGAAASAVSSHASASDPHGDRAYANSAIASAASNFATAAQGSKADTAVQPGSLGSASTHAASDFAAASHGHSDATTSTDGFMSAADKAKLNTISGTNTGDETETSIKTKLGITILGSPIVVQVDEPTGAANGTIWINPADPTTPLVGPPPNLEVGVISTLSPGSNAAFSLAGTSPNYIVNVGLPQGLPGSPPNLSVGTLSTLSPGSNITASFGGTPPNYSLNLGIPQGTPGSPPNLSIGTLSTLSPGSNITASFGGTPPNYSLNLGIPQGTPGATGLAYVDRTVAIAFSDFLYTSSSSFAPFNIQAFGTGSNWATSPLASANHPGVVVLKSGTAGTSGNCITTDQAACVIGPNYLYEAGINFASFASEGYVFGWTVAAGSGDPTTGVYFYLNGSGVANAKAATASTRSATGTQYTLSLSTWYRLQFVVNASATRVDFYIYDTANPPNLLWTDYVTSNIPTSTPVGGKILGYSSDTSGSKSLFHPDYLKLYMPVNR
jgi:hypothetical protein